ncbi:energy transducer TonB [Paraburkholderia sp. GAS334]|uniref:energy transducer TonB n=1 Tax=Paraburkholderia sp. GAS334 TaxID=3035131 RepID=UPI003D1C38F8
MSSPAIDMKDPQRRLQGALWASNAPTHHGRMSMKVAIGAALLVELLVIFGLSHVSFHQEPPPPPKEMRVQMAPPPPPPPPEVKKLEPPPAPEPQKVVPKHVEPKPLPTPKPPPATPSPAPKEANIAAAVNPSANAPALATANATPGPATAATGAAPVAPPALHGVVDGRGHCSSVQPQIPRRALEQGISANVIAHLAINADGSVGEVKIVRVTPPTSVFNEAVITAGRAYKCEKNAEPYVGEVEFSFKTAPSEDDQ